jgi:hypothetical protein
MWQQSVGDKVTYSQAVAAADDFALAGHSDWRLPTIKELYSLIDFSGLDVRPESGSASTPFIDTDSFGFEYGDTSAGERIIDAQWVSSTEYVGGDLVFGVNFADGRSKGYGLTMPGGDEKTFFVRYVRGNPAYGMNEFVDNGNGARAVARAESGETSIPLGGEGTVSDLATGLIWAQDDYPVGLDWQNALAYIQDLNDAMYLGYTDWRLPNAKELQSIVDYTRSPGTTDSPAVDPIFNATRIADEEGQWNWGFYWTSTTHASTRGGQAAVYIAFGEALGYMNGRWIDVHGAGAQRSDPKIGNASQYPYGNGPQGDAVRVFNYLRAVRDVG